MECVWTDYIGSTEECETAECYDGLYFSEHRSGATDYDDIVVYTEDEFYTIEEFTIPASQSITILLDINLELFPDNYLILYLDTNASTGFSIDTVVQEGDIYVHTLSFTIETEGVLEKIVTDGSESLSAYVSGIGLPNGELRTFCTPLLLGISIS